MVKRATHKMPDVIADALEKHGVRAEYDARPHYQRNDYIGWITSAKSDETRDRHIAQMIDELKRGGIYMGMTHAPSRKTS